MKLDIRNTVIGAGLAGLLICSAAIAGAPGHDRGKHHGKFGAEQQLSRMQRALDLSDDQTVELLVILQAAEEERRATFERVMEEVKPEICAQRDMTHSEILEVLTAEQAAEFESHLAERGARFEEGGRGGRPELNCD